eukprot:6213026-Pleurochrysis_carterae.AAC.4
MRARGLGAPAGRLRVGGASGRRRPCRMRERLANGPSGDEKLRERSASAPRVHMRHESKTGNNACERELRRTATV